MKMIFSTVLSTKAMKGTSAAGAGVESLQSANDGLLNIVFTALLLAGLALSFPVQAAANESSRCEQLRAEHGPEVISVHCGQAPGPAMTADGTLLIAFVQDRHIYVTQSSDQGRSYSEPVQVNAEPEEVEFNGENRPKLVRDRDGSLYISWTTKTEGNHTGNIRFSRSTDSGASFSTPITINDDGLLTGHRFDSMLLTPSGHLYLTWLDKRELEAAVADGKPYEGSAVFYTVSSDQGKSFSANHKIADHSCECCRIAVAPHGEDSLALSWRQLYEGARDHAIAVVNPEGERLHFNRASEDDWQINACPHHGPDMAPAGTADSGNYHLVWFSNGNINQGIHYGFHSLETGQTQRIHQVDGNAGAGHPQVVEFNGVTWLAWKRFDGEKTQLKLIHSRDQGLSWSEPQTVATTAEASDHPQLLTSADGVYLAWLTSQDGYIVQRLTDSLQPFTADSFRHIKQLYKGQPFLVGLWSVDCPPCLVELDMLGKMKEQSPELPLVLISTDPISNREDAQDFLLDYGLDGITSWMFADSFVERLRYSIDPGWYGELPRSYFFNADHQPQSHSGIMSEAMVREWLGY